MKADTFAESTYALADCWKQLEALRALQEDEKAKGAIQSAMNSIREAIDCIHQSYVLKQRGA